MPSAPISFGQLMALVLIVLLAAWLIRRAGQSLRDVLNPPKGTTGSVLTPEQVAAITGQGLATAEQLFMMSAKDQRLLAISAVALQSAQNQRPTREQ
jgi:hypothetical protein